MHNKRRRASPLVFEILSAETEAKSFSGGTPPEKRDERPPERLWKDDVPEWFAGLEDRNIPDLFLDFGEADSSLIQEIERFDTEAVGRWCQSSLPLPLFCFRVGSYCVQALQSPLPLGGLRGDFTKGREARFSTAKEEWEEMPLEEQLFRGGDSPGGAGARIQQKGGGLEYGEDDWQKKLAESNEFARSSVPHQAQQAEVHRTFRESVNRYLRHHRPMPENSRRKAPVGAQPDVMTRRPSELFPIYEYPVQPPESQKEIFLQATEFLWPYTFTVFGRALRKTLQLDPLVEFRLPLMQSTSEILPLLEDAKGGNEFETVVIIEAAAAVCSPDSLESDSGVLMKIVEAFKENGEKRTAVVVAQIVLSLLRLGKYSTLLEFYRSFLKGWQGELDAWAALHPRFYTTFILLGMYCCSLQENEEGHSLRALRVLSELAREGLGKKRPLMTHTPILSKATTRHLMRIPVRIFRAFEKGLEGEEGMLEGGGESAEIDADVDVAGDEEEVGEEEMLPSKAEVLTTLLETILLLEKWNYNTGTEALWLFVMSATSPELLGPDLLRDSAQSWNAPTRQLARVAAFVRRGNVDPFVEHVRELEKMWREKTDSWKFIKGSPSRSKLRHRTWNVIGHFLRSRAMVHLYMLTAETQLNKIRNKKVWYPELSECHRLSKAMSLIRQMMKFGFPPTVTTCRLVLKIGVLENRYATWPVAWIIAKNWFNWGLPTLETYSHYRYDSFRYSAGVVLEAIVGSLSDKQKRGNGEGGGEVKKDTVADSQESGEVTMDSPLDVVSATPGYKLSLCAFKFLAYEEFTSFDGSMRKKTNWHDGIEVTSEGAKRFLWIVALAPKIDSAMFFSSQFAYTRLKEIANQEGKRIDPRFSAAFLSICARREPNPYWRSAIQLHQYAWRSRSSLSNTARGFDRDRFLKGIFGDLFLALRRMLPTKIKPSERADAKRVVRGLVSQKPIGPRPNEFCISDHPAIAETAIECLLWPAVDSQRESEEEQKNRVGRSSVRGRGDGEDGKDRERADSENKEGGGGGGRYRDEASSTVIDKSNILLAVRLLKETQAKTERLLSLSLPRPREVLQSLSDLNATDKAALSSALLRARIPDSEAHTSIPSGTNSSRLVQTLEKTHTDLFVKIGDAWKSLRHLFRPAAYPRRYPKRSPLPSDSSSLHPDTTETFEAPSASWPPTHLATALSGFRPLLASLYQRKSSREASEESLPLWIDTCSNWEMGEDEPPPFVANSTVDTFACRSPSPITQFYLQPLPPWSDVFADLADRSAQEAAAADAPPPPNQPTLTRAMYARPDELNLVSLEREICRIFDLRVRLPDNRADEVSLLKHETKVHSARLFKPDKYVHYLESELHKQAQEDSTLHSSKRGVKMMRLNLRQLSLAAWILTQHYKPFRFSPQQSQQPFHRQRVGEFQYKDHAHFSLLAGRIVKAFQPLHRFEVTPEKFICCCALAFLKQRRYNEMEHFLSTPQIRKMVSSSSEEEEDGRGREYSSALLLWLHLLACLLAGSQRHMTRFIILLQQNFNRLPATAAPPAPAYGRFTVGSVIESLGRLLIDRLLFSSAGSGGGIAGSPSRRQGESSEGGEGGVGMERWEKMLQVLLMLSEHRLLGPSLMEDILRALRKDSSNTNEIFPKPYQVWLSSSPSSSASLLNGDEPGGVPEMEETTVSAYLCRAFALILGGRFDILCAEAPFVQKLKLEKGVKIPNRILFKGGWKGGSGVEIELEESDMRAGAVHFLFLKMGVFASAVAARDGRSELARSDKGKELAMMYVVAGVAEAVEILRARRGSVNRALKKQSASKQYLQPAFERPDEILLVYFLWTALLCRPRDAWVVVLWLMQHREAWQVDRSLPFFVLALIAACGDYFLQRMAQWGKFSPLNESLFFWLFSYGVNVQGGFSRGEGEPVHHALAFLDSEKAWIRTDYFDVADSAAEKMRNFLRGGRTPLFLMRDQMALLEMRKKKKLLSEQSFRCVLQTLLLCMGRVDEKMLGYVRTLASRVGELLLSRGKATGTHEFVSAAAVLLGNPPRVLSVPYTNAHDCGSLREVPKRTRAEMEMGVRLLRAAVTKAEKDGVATEGQDDVIAFFVAADALEHLCRAYHGRDNRNKSIVSLLNTLKQVYQRAFRKERLGRHRNVNWRDEKKIRYLKETFFSKKEKDPDPEEGEPERKPD
uniref:Uncharacterized protein n=1 Tax=Chromera velia CCMP2878 TaxID=1169474 RepID=A0A0G4FAI0_9ALVE|eukprot:Cvel_16041.t1-p1 / transcript=Cvel_16041.t1 / gene=Cvel_16041 / organism=Chromera_velia_CCMP2878 / gene_product=hypothetical protein / transcript_product=hypothetical protein / location=Cvel_scaffold1218:41005-49152(-) / protein_length=2169 / sequence_SO=supercontig / SO=protein_coding / is_pseudo=false